VRMRSPAWFGEGNEKISIDGEAIPSIWGTGTEDYFLSAWGLQTASTPYFGVPFFVYRTIGGHVSSYRWHLHDPIVFNTGIKVTLEHMGWMSEDENPDYQATSWNEREDDYANVAFWYQTGIPTFEERAPGADKRRLPSLARIVVKADDLMMAGRHGEGEILTAAGRLYEEDMLVYQPPHQERAWLEFPIEVEAKEPLRLVVNAFRSMDGGRYQAFLDGVKIGRPLDFYSETPKSWAFPLLDFWPDPGKYTLRLLERRPRVAEYGHDRDKDWRENPILYR